MTRLIVHPAARRDYQDALSWYADQSEEIGPAFREALLKAFDRVAADPNCWPVYGRKHRFHKVERFPYRVIYRVLEDVIEIVAVAHTSRRDFWRKR